jgi:chromosome segregation protein
LLNFLKEITIFGFKSFADKTTIQFKDGLNMIVGPNGCGKSNIIDAFCWGLGENKLKTLRANNTGDLLFAGNDKRQGSPLASVSFVIDNTQGILKVEDKTLKVKRSLTKDGESQYFINEKPCRLKDIQHLFMDTGLGKSGYSIMQQGKMDQIIVGKPTERRQIFEEASGISFSKNLVRESELKLEKTRFNIERLEDILKEVESQVQVLKEQADKAYRFKEIKREIEQQQKDILLFQYIEVLEKVSSKEQKEKKLKQELEDLKKEVADLKTDSMESFENIGEWENGVALLRDQEQEILIHEAKVGQKIELIRKQHQTTLEDLKKLSKKKESLMTEQSERKEKVKHLTLEKERLLTQEQSFEKKKQETIENIESLNKKLKETQTVLEEVDKAILTHEALLQQQLLQDQERLLSFVEKLDASDIPFHEISKESKVYKKIKTLLEQLKTNISSHNSESLSFEELQKRVQYYEEFLTHFENLFDSFGEEIVFLFKKLTKDPQKSLSEFQQTPPKENVADKIQKLREKKTLFTESMKRFETEKNSALEYYENTFLMNTEKSREENIHIQVDFEKLKEEIHFYNDQILTVDEQEVDLKEQKNQLEEEIFLLVEEYEKFQSNKKELTQKIENLKSKIGESSQKLSKMKEQEQELGKKIGLVAEKLNDCYLSFREWEVQQEIFAKDFRERYSQPIAQVIQENPSYFEAFRKGEFDGVIYKKQIQKKKEELEKIGLVNLLAIEEFEEVSKRYEHLQKNKQDLTESEKDLLKLIADINKKATEDFLSVFHQVNENLKQIFVKSFEGGSCEMVLTDPLKPLETGIEINVKPPGKKLQNLTLLSGGEKTMVALSLMFSLFMVKPSPFCLLDEVDAALDEVNIQRFLRILNEFKENVQFLIITHNRVTAQKGDIFYGVTMQETGVTKVFSFKPRQ